MGYLELTTMDLTIRAFSNQIVEVLNGNPLPMEIKRLVLEEVLTKVTAEANRQITEQQKKIIGGNADELREDGMEK